MPEKFRQAEGQEEGSKETLGLMEMVRLEWFHFCEYCFATSTGKPGIIGIHEGVLVDQFPVSVSFSMAFQLRGAPHKSIPVVIHIVLPNGKELAKLECSTHTNEDGGAYAQMAFIVPVDQAGTYVVKLVAAGAELPSQSIHVRMSPAHEKGTGKPN